MNDDDRPGANQADLPAIKQRWVGVEFDVASFEMEPDRMVAWAQSCGDTDPRFIDPTHPDFQAYPNYTTHFTTHRILPDDFPKIGPGFGIDANALLNRRESELSCEYVTLSVSVTRAFADGCRLRESKK